MGKEFQSHVPEIAANSPKKVALCCSDAVLWIIDPYPHLHIYGIILEAHKEVFRLGGLEDSQGIRGGFYHQDIRPCRRPQGYRA